MAKHIASTPDAGPPGGPYSQAVVAGDFVYLAGAIPSRPDGTRVQGSFREQAETTFDNLATVAEAANASLADAVRVGVYLRDLENFAEMNECFAEYFGAAPPARTTLRADLPGFDIEADAVLYRPSNEGGPA